MHEWCFRNIQIGFGGFPEDGANGIPFGYALEVSLFSASSNTTQVDSAAALAGGGLLSELEIGLTMTKPGVQRFLCSSGGKCRGDGTRGWALETSGNWLVLAITLEGSSIMLRTKSHMRPLLWKQRPRRIHRGSKILFFFPAQCPWRHPHTCRPILGKRTSFSLMRRSQPNDSCPEVRTLHRLSV